VAELLTASGIGERSLVGQTQTALGEAMISVGVRSERLIDARESTLIQLTDPKTLEIDKEISN
jgi:hypothetical protein